MATQRQLALQLLSQAGEDYRAALVLADSEDISDATVGFHVQQAVEKSIKSVLADAAVDFPFSHDLQHLQDLAGEAGTPVPPVLSGSEILTQYAATARYGEIPGLPILEISKALDGAREGIDWASKHLEDQ